MRELLNREPANDAEAMLYGSVIAYLFTDEHMELRTFIGAREAQDVITSMSHARFSLVEQMTLRATWLSRALRVFPSMIYVSDAEDEYQLALREIDTLPSIGNYFSRNDIEYWINENPEQVERARQLHRENDICATALHIVYEAQAKLADQSRLKMFPQRFAQAAPDPHTAPVFEILRFYTSLSLVLGVGDTETKVVGSQRYKDAVGSKYLQGVMDLCADTDLPSIREYLSTWTELAHTRLHSVQGLAPDPQMAAPIVDLLNLYHFPHCGAAVESSSYLNTEMESIVNDLIRSIYEERRRQWAAVLDIDISQVSATPQPIGESD
jgi:hypothetical protein